MGEVNSIIKQPRLIFVNYSDIINWSVSYLISNDFGYNKKYNLFKLGDFLKKNRNTIMVDDESTYSRVTIKLYNKGVHKRDELKGKGIGTKKQYLVKEGQFIISKIDARNGAFGIVPESLEGAITTADFLSYDIDVEKISPYFLTLLTATKQFSVYCQGASSGTTGRQRINEASFLNVNIPLPSLEDQRNMVDSYNDIIKLVKQKEQQATQLEKDLDNYFFDVLGVEKNKDKKSLRGLQFIGYVNLHKWSLDSLLKENILNIEEGKYKTLNFKSIITFFEGGKTPSKSRADFWNGAIAWTSPKDFNGIFIEKSQDHITDIAVQEAGMKVFPVGVFLSVFRSGILRHSFPTAITQIETAINQDLKAYAVNEKMLNKYYFLYFIHTFKDMILKRASKKSVTVESINTEDFMEILIPVPPMKIQNEIVSTIEKMKAEIKSLQQQAKEYRKSAIEEFEQAIFQ
ncbi:MAG: restriction endonuclease subunit S [Methylococcaceae bacterium]|nr:restriction endonuclease subunit S [Methylococcaceae bacterium]